MDMTPAHKRWTAEHQRLLKQAREQADVTDAVLARNSTMTLRQLQQLEQGGSSAFYSEAIQYDMGMKLLRRLNVPASVLSSLEASASLHATRPTEAVVHEGIAAYSPTASSAAGNAPPPEPSHETAVAGHTWRIVWALIGLGLLGAGFLITVWPTASDERVPTSTEVTVETPGHVDESAPAPATVNPVADETDQRAMAEPVVLPQRSGCDLDSNARTLSPDRPTKPADYVYLVASDPVVVCIQDADGRQTRLTLQAGRNVNIRGRPPFDLTADTWSHLQVFFQGQRMALPAGMTGVRLQAHDTRH
jgi:transcriptional regulator with XRE-family HTH domain